jgi:hypothetical protein
MMKMKYRNMCSLYVSNKMEGKGNNTDFMCSSMNISTKLMLRHVQRQHIHGHKLH